MVGFFVVVVANVMFSNAQLAIPFLYIVVVNKRKFIVKKQNELTFHISSLCYSVLF